MAECDVETQFIASGKEWCIRLVYNLVANIHKPVLHRSCIRHYQPYEFRPIELRTLTSAMIKGLCFHGVPHKNW